MCFPSTLNKWTEVGFCMFVVKGLKHEVPCAFFTLFCLRVFCFVLSFCDELGSYSLSSCISADEKDTIVSSRTPISVLRETDMNGKVNISSHMPCYNEQNVRAELLTETITEDENRKVKVGDEGMYTNFAVLVP